jgi:hypothetical protein
MWTEGERKAANADCMLVHKGQTVADDGRVDGAPAKTNTLGFRWNAVNNLLVHQGVVGEGEWKASSEADEDNADKAQRQFVWAVPSKAAAVDLTEFDAAAITRRTTKDMRARVPSWCRRITVGIDVGKWLCHWTALAWGEHATPHVIEYGRLEVPSREMAEELAITTGAAEVPRRDPRDGLAGGRGADEAHACVRGRRLPAGHGAGLRGGVRANVLGSARALAA